MSNLVIKYGSGDPQKDGGLAPHLADLNDISSSQKNGYALSYSSSSTSWESQKLAETSRTVFYSWQLATIDTANGNPTYTYDANDNVIWRNGQAKILDATYVTRVTASGSLVPLTTTAWTQYWTLKASGLNGKKIRLEAVHMANAVTGSTEQVVYQWGRGSGNLATYTPIGNRAYQTDRYTQVALGEFTMGASDVNVALKVVSVNGVASILRGNASGSESAFASYVSLSILEG